MGRHAQRYWDGQQWTDHVADVAGNMTVDPLNQPAPQEQAATQAADTGGGAAAGAADATATGAVAAGAATASVESGDTSTAWSSEPATTDQQPTGGDWAAAAQAHVDVPDEDDGVDDWDDTDGGVVSLGGIVAIEVDDDSTVVAVPDAIVARQQQVGVQDEERGRILHGHGTVWLRSGGRHIAVLTLPEAGLVVARHALVATTADVVHEDAHAGIAGFDGTRISGPGWVAVAGAGGIAELSAQGGVAVAAAGLVAWQGDLDVEHHDDVVLTGLGSIWVAAG